MGIPNLHILENLTIAHMIHPTLRENLCASEFHVNFQWYDAANKVTPNKTILLENCVVLRQNPILSKLPQIFVLVNTILKIVFVNTKCVQMTSLVHVLQHRIMCNLSLQLMHLNIDLCVIQHRFMCVDFSGMGTPALILCSPTLISIFNCILFMFIYDFIRCHWTQNIEFTDSTWVKIETHHNCDIPMYPEKKGKVVCSDNPLFNHNQVKCKNNQTNSQWWLWWGQARWDKA